MNRTALVFLILSASTALAASPTYNMIVGGQVVPGQAVLLYGQTYVPLSALGALGISGTLRGTTLTLSSRTLSTGLPPGPVTPGGADQRTSLEGCRGQTLFNGVWRLKVGAVRPLTRYNGQQRGYGLSLDWKNGTPKAIDALNTGVKNFTLVLASGATLSAENEQDLKFRKLPQAAGTSLELTFWADSAASATGLNQPSKLLVDIDPSGAAPSGVAYTTSTPSFRVQLDCQK